MGISGKEKGELVGFRFQPIIAELKSLVTKMKAGDLDIHSPKAVLLRDQCRGTWGQFLLVFDHVPLKVFTFRDSHFPRENK